MDQTLRETFSNAREEEEKEEETGVKKKKVWETTTTSLSLSSLPMLPLFDPSMAMFCIFPCLPSEHFGMMTKTTGFRGSLVRTTHLSLYLASMCECLHAHRLYVGVN